MSIVFLEKKKTRVDTDQLTDDQYRDALEIGLLILSAAMELPLSSFNPILRDQERKPYKKRTTRTKK